MTQYPSLMVTVGEGVGSGADRAGACRAVKEWPNTIKVANRQPAAISHNAGASQRRSRSNSVAPVTFGVSGDRALRLT